MPLEGQHIGRYRLVRLLGSGGMGDVYLAEDARIEQHVAIKVIRAETSPYATGKTNEEAARLFRREARAITKLDHPNILPLFDFGEEQVGDTIMMYLVMPYRQEGSLASWLRRRADGVLLSPQEVASIVQQAAAALQHAHNREVIHQDVKPSNFLLRSREDAYSLPDLLLADFGIAHFMTATSSASQAIRGTPSYMAPEQWEGESVPATDQYALAVMAYELLTGRLPFQGGPGKMMYQHIHMHPQPPGVLRAGLSKEIDTVLLRSLAKQPEQRFASITAFASAFWQAAQGIPSIQEISPAYNIESAEKAVLPTDMPGVETAVPTLPVGSDSETYIKPVNTPASLTPALPLSRQELIPGDLAAQLPDQDRVEAIETAPRNNRSEPLTPTRTIAPTVVRSSRARRHPLLIVASIVLAMALIGGIAVAVFTLSNVRGATSSPAAPGTTTAPGTTPVTSISGTTTSVIVTIAPANRNLSNIFTITAVTGTTNASQQQVVARMLSTTTPAQSQTVPATGSGMSLATYHYSCTF